MVLATVVWISVPFMTCVGVCATAVAAERSAAPTRAAAVACDFMPFTSCFAPLRRRCSKAAHCHLELKATVPKRSVPAAGWARAAGAKLPPRHREVR